MIIVLTLNKKLTITSLRQPSNDPALKVGTEKTLFFFYKKIGIANSAIVLCVSCGQ